MPSQTFLNLDKDKREKLIESAMLEFSKHEYSDVSINQIIINAGIPRGSFYMYFKDKDDLFEYLIEMNKTRLHEGVRNILIKNDGDLYKTFIDLYDGIVQEIKDKSTKIFFKNIFIYFELRKEHFEKPGFLLYENFKDLIDVSNLKIEELEFIFVMLLHNLFMAITYGINNDCLMDKEFYLRKLNILCYGIYKK